MANEHQRSAKTYSPEHQEEAIADASHVPEEKRGLHETKHVWSRVVVVQAVGVDEDAGWATT